MKDVNEKLGYLVMGEDDKYKRRLCEKTDRELIPVSLYAVEIRVEGEGIEDIVKTVYILAPSAAEAENQAEAFVKCTMHATKLPLGIRGWGSGEF